MNFDLARDLYEPPEPPGGVLVDSAVVYLDTLGTGARCLTEPIRDRDVPDSVGLEPQAISAEGHLRRLRAAVDAAVEVGGISLRVGRHFPLHFTDNMLVGVPMAPWDEDEQGPNPDAVLAEATLLGGSYVVEFLRQGFQTRGGLTFGPHFQADGFAFGPALVRAAHMDDEKRSDDSGFPPALRIEDNAVESARLPLAALHGALWRFNDAAGSFVFVSPPDIVVAQRWFDYRLEPDADPACEGRRLWRPGHLREPPVHDVADLLREWLEAIAAQSGAAKRKVSWLIEHVAAWQQDHEGVKSREVV